MNLPELLVRLLIGVLVYFLGEKVIGLSSNTELNKILTIILIIVIVLWIVFGGTFLPLR